MKKFTETYKIENKVSLEGLEEQVQEKLKDIDGQIIDECCGDCCGTCCTGLVEPCCQSGCDTKISELRIKYHSDIEIVNTLKTDAKVQDLYDIAFQFNMLSYRSTSLGDLLENSPLYFYENTMCNTIAPMRLNSNVKLEQFIKSLCKKHGLKAPMLLALNDGSVSLFCVKHTGTNGKEGSIKSSLLEIYEMLNILEGYEEISNASCTNVEVDTADDVYAFLFRITLDKIFIINSSKQ